MSMMNIRKMGVLVSHWHVLVCMAMGLYPVPFEFVIMLVVRIMSMQMCVAERRVIVFMGMVFG